jgi:hypothetical protein
MGNEVPYRLAAKPAILGCELDEFVAISHKSKLRHKSVSSPAFLPPDYRHL